MAQRSGKLGPARLTLIAAATLPACRSTVATQGVHGTTATWSPPTLSANLDDPIRATDIAAAAEVTLRRLGYTVSERTATDDRATVVGLAPGGTRFDRIVVHAEPDVRDIRIEISTRLRPDEDRARVLLDEILVALGR